LPVPIAGENWWKREEALLEEARQHAERLRQAEGQRRAAQAEAAPWGTPQAKRAEIERARREIEASRKFELACLVEQAVAAAARD
jgi:hypothetical protein